MAAPESPDLQPGDEDLDQGAIDFLVEQRNQARAAGMDFFGAITGGDGPLLVVTHVQNDEPDQLSP
jgi:hypothetical protein